MLKFKSPDGQVFDSIEEAKKYFCSHFSTIECRKMCPLHVKRNPKKMICGDFVRGYSDSAARLMGYEIIEDKEDSDVGKPRICEVLGVEVGERFSVKDQRGGDLLYVDKDGWVKYAEDGSLSSSALQLAINHPEFIIRKPLFSQQEVEDAKTLCKMWPDEKVEFKRYANGRCGMVHVKGILHGCLYLGQVDLFPSIRPGETITLNEIIGGAE